jgi:glycine cleavage system H lipoate-binding protein
MEQSHQEISQNLNPDNRKLWICFGFRISIFGFFREPLMERTMKQKMRMIQSSEIIRDPCLWMQAGVVRSKICKTGYDCASCRFEGVMARTAEQNRRGVAMGVAPSGKRGRIVSWKDKLMARSRTRRPCIHHMKRRIEFRPCTHDYRCGDCEFDQFFHDEYLVHAVVTPVDVWDVRGFRFPQGYYFHRGHTWVKIEEGAQVRIGMDDFGLRLFGPLDRIEAPLVGREMAQGSEEISIARGPNKARIRSPVSGVVTAVNPSLRRRGRTANEDPYSAGWVMRVHAKGLRQDLKQLMLNEETRAFMDGEVDRLYAAIEDRGGPLSTDGGNLGHDIYGSMPQLGWGTLSRLFFGT